MENISKIYNARSNVVHKGKMIYDVNADENIDEIAGKYARQVLKHLIYQNSEHKGDFKKFISKIDDQKY
ncbi:hypothetical protein [Methanococcoides burtonii]|uniref:Apea-like HEPN domain-containing protein n=1 Tax=Methanococcoides burtonii (strain DSM 6242 / NBRC 107633 / OCM 468 / ACE-M) TaxID=259564 RepID=Q12VC0_METBU|nr:hypothetical protein [Methanococcoides burtonii]ABE52606.1 Hypothetical protein Mbur_1714 [Methanococcoides burtonii DSM 6242]